MSRTADEQQRKLLGQLEVALNNLIREPDEVDRFERLPKWARIHIEVLEGRIVSQQRHIDELAKPAAMITGEITHGNYDREKHCEPDDHITFYVDVADGEDFHRVPRYIQIRWREFGHPEFGIEIHGTDSIRIDPRSSNVAWVTLGRPEHG